MGTTAAYTTQHCNVFIAGAGIVGSTFARTLVDRGAHVIMADAGSCHSRRLGENRKNSWINQRDLVQYGNFVRSQLHPASSRPAASGQADYPNPLVSYAVGGMAVHWTCAIPEFHDRERMTYIDSSEWSALYARAALLLNRHVDVFSGSLRHQVIQSELLRQGWSVLDTPMAAERPVGSAYVTYTGADTVLGHLATPGARVEFEVLSEHCVQRLVRAPGNESAIEYAQVVDLKTGLLSRVYADTFVVAAGWLHTSQILFASNVHAHPDSALGRYFSDHTFAACTVLLQPKLLEAIAAKGATLKAGTPTIWGIPATDPAPHLYLPVSASRSWQGMIFRESYQFDASAGFIEDLRGIDLKWFGMIEPTRHNRVLFSRQLTDRLGMPEASFEFRLSERDLAVQAEMMTDMQKVAAFLGPYRPGAEPAFAPLGSAIHGTGLTRMGPAQDEGATSVVDPYSKVWGLDNLYLGGTSVIPTATAANPTFTAVALAIRAADHLGDRPLGP
jgi:pyranose oxidase